jgi:hypothetical protein
MIAASELKSQEIEAPVREESFPDRSVYQPGLHSITQPVEL